MDQDQRWRSPGPAGGSNTWYSPRYRGGGGGGRFRGNNSNYTPRHNNNTWQQRSPSPYRFQNQSPYNKNFNSPYNSSTPVRHHNNYQNQPYFRGGGRQHRQPFSSPHNRSGSNSIENWVSPEMWGDPWMHLLPESSLSETKFADTDFRLSESTSEIPSVSGCESKSESNHPSSPNSGSTSETISSSEVTEPNHNRPASASEDYLSTEPSCSPGTKQEELISKSEPFVDNLTNNESDNVETEYSISENADTSGLDL